MSALLLAVKEILRSLSTFFRNEARFIKAKLIRKTLFMDFIFIEIFHQPLRHHVLPFSLTRFDQHVTLIYFLYFFLNIKSPPSFQTASKLKKKINTKSNTKDFKLFKVLKIKLQSKIEKKLLTKIYIFIAA